MFQLDKRHNPRGAFVEIVPAVLLSVSAVLFVSGGSVLAWNAYRASLRGTGLEPDQATVRPRAESQPTLQAESLPGPWHTAETLGAAPTPQTSRQTDRVIGDSLRSWEDVCGMRVGAALTASEAAAQYLPQVPIPETSTAARHPARRDRIPLCVSFEQKAIARKAGAQWNRADKVWECSPSMLGRRDEQLRPFVPVMYQPERKPPYLVPLLVPQSSWGKNLRSALPKEAWKAISTEVRKGSGYRCRICGGGRGTRLHAHEQWAYDETTLVQKLVDVLAICPECHAALHMGWARVHGVADAALAHIAMINNWTMEEARQADGEASRDFEWRSQRQWRIDYSWAVERFGVSLKQ
jgi:hypothetical protein